MSHVHVLGEITIFRSEREVLWFLFNGPNMIPTQAGGIDIIG